MSSKDSRIHPQEVGTIVKQWETNSQLGSVKAPSISSSTPTIITYLNNNKWDVATLDRKRVIILSTSLQRIGMIEEATFEGKNVAINIRLSEKEDSRPEGKLAGKITTQKITLTKKGEIIGENHPIFDIKIIPDTPFTQLMQAQERFRYLAERVVLKNRHIITFCSRIDHIIQDIVQIKRLIQTYATTRELAEAYNRSQVFETYQLTLDGDLQRKNRFAHNLKKVAKALLEEFAKYKYVSQEKIEEIVGLSPMNDEDISRDIFNALVGELEALDATSLKLPNPHKVKGFAEAIRLFPPQFLRDGYVEKVLAILLKLSKWLSDSNHKFNKSGRRREECLAVLDIQRQLLDALVDNKQLKTIDEQNRCFTAVSKDDSTLSISTLLGQLREALIEEGKTTLDDEEGNLDLITPNLSTDISSLLASTLNNTENEGDFSSWWAKFQKSFITGDGLDRIKRDQIKSALGQWINESDKEIAYLASYNSQALARLPVKGDSDLSEIMRRGMHLILGAKSLALIVTSQGSALGEYKQLINHATALMKDGRLKRESWYEAARSLHALVAEADNDPQKHRAYLNSLEDILKQLKSQVSWQLLHMAFSSFYEPLVRSGHKENLQYYIILLTKIFQDKEQFTDSLQVRELALHMLLKAASDPHEFIRDLAKEQLKALHLKYKDKKTSLSHPTQASQLVRALPDVYTLAIREVKIAQENLKDNALLKKAKETVFPIEHKASKLREKVEEFRSKTEVDKDLVTYVPLKGARSKEDKDPTSFFLLQKQVEEFVRADNRRRDYEGYLLNAKGERLKDSGNQPLRTGKHPETVADPAVLLIHGQAGSGKSLFGRFIEREYWHRYESGSVIPLFISLPALRDPFHQGIEQALSEYGFSPDEIQQMKNESHQQGGETIETLRIKKENDEKKLTTESDVDQAFEYGFSPDEIENQALQLKQVKKLALESKKESINPPRLLLILDGYDELQTQINLYQAYQLATWKNIKVIITSRTEYLEQLGNYYRHFKPKEGNLEEVFIRPFNQDQIETFVSQILEQKQMEQTRSFNLEDYLDYIQEAKLDDLIEHPFMLRIIVDILPLLKENKEKEKALGLGQARVKRYDVYELFLTQLFEKNGVRLRRGPLPDGFQAESSLWEYSTAVACFMYTHRRQTIQGNPPSFSRFKATEEQGAHFLTNEPKIALSKSGAPFKKMGEASFAFIHKSIQEFLVARVMREEYLKAFEHGQELLQGTLINQRPIQEEPSIARFIMDVMTLKDIQALEKIIRSTQIKPKEEGKLPEKSPLSQASANAMTLIVAKGSRYYHNEDFSYIQIPGAKLDGGYFVNVDFTGADFSRVSARQTMFEGCNWTCLQASQIDFGESPYIRVEGNVTSLAYSPDGKKLATGSFSGIGSRNYDSIIHIWDVATGEMIGEPLRGHTGEVTSINFSPDGKKLATGSRDNTVRLWEVNKGEAIGEPFRGHTEFVTSVSFSLDGKNLATGSYGATVCIWDIDNRGIIDKPFKEVKSDYAIITFSPDGKKLASWNKTIRLWDVATGEPLGEPLEENNSTIQSVAFSPDGKILAAGSLDGYICFWDVHTRKILRKLLKGHESSINSVAFSPDGKRLATGSGNNGIGARDSGDVTICIWDVSTGELIGERLRGHTKAVNSLIFSPDGKRLTTASRDHTIRFWDVASREGLGVSLPVQEDPINSIAFSPDGKRLAVGSGDHIKPTINTAIRIWDTTTGEMLIETSDGDPVTSIVFSPDGKILATGMMEIICLLDPVTGELLRDPLEGHTDGVTSVAFSPDGKILATGSIDKTICLWDAVTGELLGSPLKGHKYTVRSIVFSPDGEKLATGSDDYTIRLWDMATRKMIGKPLKKHTDIVTSVAFSPDGKRLATGSEDKTVCVWDVETGKTIEELMKKHEEVVTSVTFSPNGEILATGSTDKTIHLWNAVTGEKIVEPLKGHEDWVTSVSFSFDGKKLATGSKDKTVRLWDVTNPKVPKLENILGRWDLRLILKDIQGEGVLGLSVANQKLLEQHGATITPSDSSLSDESMEETLNLSLTPPDILMKQILELSKEIQELKALVMMDQKV